MDGLENWGWLVRGLEGNINLIERLVRHKVAINTTHSERLKECADRLNRLIEPTESLNQDVDQGARVQPASQSDRTDPNTEDSQTSNWPERSDR